MSIILHSVTRWNYIPKNLYEMQFLLLIGTHCAGGCVMDSRKEWFMPRIQVYKVNKMWFLWSVFSCLSKLQFSHSLQCSSPHHFGYHWHVEGFRYAFLFVGVIPDSLWKRRESPAVPMTATAPGRTQGNVRCIPRIWESQKAHMSCDSYWFFASSPCSAYTFLCGYHQGLPVTVNISRTLILPGALGVHTPCFMSSCAASGSSYSACLPTELWVPKDICLDGIQILAIST